MSEENAPSKDIVLSVSGSSPITLSNVGAAEAAGNVYQLKLKSPSDLSTCPTTPALATLSSLVVIALTSIPIFAEKAPEVAVAPPFKPFDVPIVTDVMSPKLDVLPLNVFQSVFDKYPLADPVATGIYIVGVGPPVDRIGAVADTLVTPMSIIPLTTDITLPYLSTVKSADVYAPGVTPEDANPTVISPAVHDIVVCAVGTKST